MSLTRRGVLAAGGGLGALAVTAVGGGTAAAAGAHGAASGRGGRGPVRTGFDRLAADGYRLLAGERVGIVTNPTGVTSDVRHIVDVMHADDRVNLTAVFGPEHGFRGTAQAGGSEGRYDDPATGLPVYDTYLKNGSPLADVFTASGVDTVVFDIQDAGARFYTYIWTLYDCMEAAALAGKRFVVLDRPNPVTGRAALGPVLDPAFGTFVGRREIAQAHGMTVAELALFFNTEFFGARPADLDTVTMSGWRRSDFFDATGLPWVPPSPNMPTADTALVYSGTCLFEGTNLSEGRGTTRPFELLGAAGIDHRWAAAANALELPGVHFREAYFAPTFSKFSGVTVGGVQLHVDDREVFDPVRTGIALLVTAKATWSGFAWRADDWIDKLTGNTRVRTMIDAGADTDEVVAAWRSDLAAFRAKRKKYLLYGG
ncbi:exo-beta-N-acetylmuramidase NamZ domain-containing protein [Streptomyces sp. NPDC008125]|uniref:exo-beta-N-acetylmuramidase NamZ family protein n=1 Tax=Streptomyces sp. NPDC008125 TaxID=3364811 RepID=UPI0036E6989A